MSKAWDRHIFYREDDPNVEIRSGQADAPLQEILIEAYENIRAQNNLPPLSSPTPDSESLLRALQDAGWAYGGLESEYELGAHMSHYVWAEVDAEDLPADMFGNPVKNNIQNDVSP